MTRRLITIALIAAAVCAVFTESALGGEWIMLQKRTAEAYAKGDYAAALEYGLRALAQAEVEFVGKGINYSTSLSDLGLIKLRQGAYTEAERLFREAAQIRKDLWGERNLYYAVSMHNLARVYLETGQYEAAHALCRRSVEIRQLLGKKDAGYAASLNLLIVICQKLNYAAEADSLSLEAEGLEGATTTDTGRAAFLNTRGIRSYLNGEFAEAEKDLSESLRIIKTVSGTEHLNYADAAGNLGAVYKSMRRFDKALELLTECVSIRAKILNTYHPSYSEALGNLAALYADMKRWEDAEAMYREQNANLLLQIREYFPGLSEGEKESFWSKTKYEIERFNFFATLCIQRDSSLIGDMYDLQLATKGLLLNSAAKVKRSVLGGTDSSGKELYWSWKRNKEALSRLLLLPEQGASDEAIGRDSLEAETIRMERELSRRSHSFADAYGSSELSWRRVQAALKPGEAAVEIIRYQYFDRVPTDTIYYAALVLTSSTLTHPEIVVLENGKMLEEEYYANYVRTLRQSEPDEISYRQYWEKIARALRGITTVYFSADGVYNQINVQALGLPARGFVIDSTDVLLVGNTKRLLDARPAASVIQYGGKSAVLFAAPDGQRWQLPETEREVIEISEILSPRMRAVRMYVGKNATEENLLLEKHPAIVHIATHGFFNDVTHEGVSGRTGESQLLRSMLLFAGADWALGNGTAVPSGNNGILTAYEAMNLDLDSTELVVLSACETGKGRVVNGEGVYGFQRSFEAAGARNVILSLWKVDDRFTRALMVRFYRQWLEMSDKHAAFRMAVLEMKKKYPAPYYWAAFIMTGQ